MCSAKENEAYTKAVEMGLAKDIKRRPFKKYAFTGDYAPWHMRAEKLAQRQREDKVHACVGGDPLSAYLNGAQVKEALHVTSKSPAWVDCKGDIKYTVLQKGSQWIYEYLKGEIKMLHYSGDKDGVVPGYGTLGWISNLKWKTLNKWREYTEAGAANEAARQTAGFFWQMDGLDFGTVHGAGHMVPMDQPARGY